LAGKFWGSEKDLYDMSKRSAIASYPAVLAYSRVISPKHPSLLGGRPCQDECSSGQNELASLNLNGKNFEDFFFRPSRTALFKSHSSNYYRGPVGALTGHLLMSR
jgi:hypothetical protein